MSGVHAQKVRCPLGVQIQGGRFVVLLAAGARIPARGARTFTTVAAGQTTADIPVVELAGGSPLALGTVVLSGIREAWRGAARIGVRFQLASDGLLIVTARDLDGEAAQTAFLWPARALGGGGTEEAGRVAALAGRVASLSRAPELELEAAFGEEIREVLAESSGALRGRGGLLLRDCRVALEALLGELAVRRRERRRDRG